MRDLVTPSGVDRLVDAVLERPDERDSALVLADWCEEQGYTVTAWTLRGELRDARFFSLLTALEQRLMGVPQTGEQITALGVPSAVVMAGEMTTVTVVSLVPVRIVHLALRASSPFFVCAITCDDLDVEFEESVPASTLQVVRVFDKNVGQYVAPSLFPTQQLRMTVENRSLRESEFRCALKVIMMPSHAALERELQGI